MMRLRESIFLYPPINTKYMNRILLTCPLTSCDESRDHCLSQEDGWMWVEPKTWKCSPMNTEEKHKVARAKTMKDAGREYLFTLVGKVNLAINSCNFMC